MTDVQANLTILPITQQGFQYFSSLPVLCYLQAVLCITIWTFLWISYTILFKIRRYQIPF